jgi:hypothetical protein
MIGRKALVLFRIAYLSIPILILLKRMFDIDIYFINKDHMDKINYLEEKRIKWIKKEYKEFSQFNKGMFLAADFANEIYKKTKKSSIHSFINRILTKSKNHREKMDVAWKYYLLRGIGAFADQYAAALFLRDSGRYDSITIVAFNSLAYFLDRKKTTKIKIYIYPGLFFYKITEKFLFYLSNRIKYIKKKFGRKIENSPVLVQGEQYRSKLFDIENIKVVYFPHKGIYYGDLFKKDHFYSDNEQSPLNKSKILHLSLGEKNAPYMLENYQYYVKNDIPFADINDIGYDRKKLVRVFLKLLAFMNISLVTDLIKYGPWYIAYGFFLFLSIKRYCLIFSRFSSLKIALVGYDFLFPRNLSIALNLLGVNVCASQERLILAFGPNDYYIFDYYFVAGKVVVERGLKNSIIDNCIPVGMPREDILYDYEQKKIFDEKYDAIKKTKKLVLALDYQMSNDDVEDISRPVAKVYQTRQFYRDLIRLAHKFPYIHIAIKGKVSELYKSPYIADIVEEIKGIENIEIELNLKKYNPYFLSEKADLTIACYTSLADELLAAGRKVIFYEVSDLMETLLPYENLPIIVKDYNGLKRHVENFLNGVYLDESVIKTLQEKYYANCFHGKVQKTVREMLEKIIKEGDLKEHDVKVISSTPQIRKAGGA